jgi:autotransporter-associated beta strand protein
MTCAGLSSWAHAQNLLADPGFEVSDGNVDASAGDQFGANGWNVFGGGTYTASDLFDGPPAHTGDQTFKTFGQYNGGYQQFTVTPGQTYTASVWSINSSTANNGNDVESAGTIASLELDFFTDSAGDGADYTTIPVITGGGPTAGGSPLNTWEQGMLTLTVPTGFNTLRFQINQTSPNPGGAAYWDDASLVLDQVTTSATWTGGGADNNWMTAGNWGGTAPVADDLLFFDGTTRPNATNNFAANTQFNGITFNSGAGPFGLSGNAINIGGNIVNNSTALETVNTNLTLLQPTTFTATAGNLAIGSAISGSFGVEVLGPGSVTFSGSNSYTGATNVDGGTLVVSSAHALPAGTGLVIGTTSATATVQLAKGSGVSTVTSLTINGGSTLDITNSGLVINYAGSPSPLATIIPLVAGGTITSSDLPAGYAVGYADGTHDVGTSAAAQTILIKRTLIGDTNLDGTVNLTDLLNLLNNYGQAGRDWSQGDVNYDGSVNLTDLLDLLNNYGQTAGSASLASSQVVPEPAMTSLLLLGAGSILSRRRRA